MPGSPITNPNQLNAAQRAQLQKNRAGSPNPSITTGPSISQLPPARQKSIRANMAAEHTRNMQQFLKNRGYNISVDGIRGPQTNAVVAAFHNKVTPDQYNNKGKPVAATATASTGGTVTPAVKPTKPTGKTKGGGGGGGSRTPASPSTPSVDPSTVDPYAYATAAAGAEYDPQIAAAQAQLSQLGPQHAQNNADLQSWYGQLRGLISKQSAGQDADSQAQLAEYDKAANNAASQLFGGAANPADGAAMAFHDINRTALQGQDNAQSDFLSNMQPILAAQGTDALRSEIGAYNRNKLSLGQQVGALKGAKGQAYTKALAEGQQQQIQQQTAQQSLAMAQQLMPYQVQTAKAQAASARADASAAKQTAAANLALVNANVQKAQAQAAAASGGTGWDLNNPADRGSLSQAIRTSIGSQQGTLRVSPSIALQNINQALAQAGLQDDPQAQAIAQSVFQEVLNNSHSAKLWRHVTYENGQLVVHKPKPKKK